MGEKEAQIFKPQLRPEEMDATQDTEAVFAADEARTELVAATVQETEETTTNTSHEAEDATEKGFFARAGEFARDHMPPKLTAGLAAAALLVGGAAELAGKDTEKAEAATSSRTLGPNALKKLCVEAGLKMPVMTKVEGDDALSLGAMKSSDYQFWNVYLQENVVPADCNGKYKRFVWAKPEVQNPTNHRQWFPATRPKWNFLMASNTGVKGDSSDPNYSDSIFSATNQFIVDKTAKRTKQTQLYRCTPGRGVTDARMKLKHGIKDINSGKFVAKRTKKYPVNVGYLGRC